MHQKLNPLTLYVTGNIKDSFRFPYTAGPFETISYDGWNVFLDPMPACYQALSTVLDKKPDQVVLFAVEENCIIAALICAFLRSKIPTLPVSLLLDTIPPVLSKIQQPSFSPRHDILLNDPAFLQQFRMYGDFKRILDETKPGHRPRYIHAMFAESEQFDHLRKATIRCIDYLSCSESFHVPKSTRHYMLINAGARRRDKDPDAVNRRVAMLHDMMASGLFE